MGRVRGFQWRSNAWSLIPQGKLNNGSILTSVQSKKRKSTGRGEKNMAERDEAAGSGGGVEGE